LIRADVYRGTELDNADAACIPMCIYLYVYGILDFVEAVSRTDIYVVIYLMDW